MYKYSKFLFTHFILQNFKSGKVQVPIIAEYPLLPIVMKTTRFPPYVCFFSYKPKQINNTLFKTI